MLDHEPSISFATPKRGGIVGFTAIDSYTEYLRRLVQTRPIDLAISSGVQHNRSESICSSSLHECPQVGQTFPVIRLNRAIRPKPTGETPAPWWGNRRVSYQNGHLPSPGLRPWFYYLVAGQIGESSAPKNWEFSHQQRNYPTHSGTTWSPVSDRSNLVRKQRSRIRSKKNAIIQIYRHRPHWGQVVCFDEMGPLQTIPRGGKAWGQRAPLRPDRYKRNGTVQWFCAFNPHNGIAVGKGFPSKSAESCRTFWLDHLLPSWPKGRIHLVMDNLSAHKKGFGELPARIRRRISVYWTPTNSSWLNLVESYFATLQRNALHNTDYKKPEEIENALCRATLYLNENPRAYVWKKI